MWRRSATTDVKSSQQLAASSPRPLATLDDLLRRAEWDRLAEDERARLLGNFQGSDVPGFDDTATESGLGPQTRLQDLIASLVAFRFQPQAAAVIQNWLTDGSPDGHLYVGGGPGQGRTSLAASCARQAMAHRPAPPEYCYVPDLNTLDRPAVLAVPKGVGARFIGNLIMGLRIIANRWESGDDSDNSDESNNSDNSGNSNPSSDSNGSDGSNGSNGSNGAAAQAQNQSANVPAARLQLLTDLFASLIAASPQAVRDYLSKLQVALAQRVEDDLPFDGDSIPAAHISPVADSLPGAADGYGAPVVVTSLAQTELSDVLLRANGGVLILQTTDLLDANTWGTLSDALKTRTLTLKQGWPAIPLTVRVILIGSGASYRTLDGNTEDFSRLFRYEVWCNWDVPWTSEAEATYAALMNGVSKRHGHPPFDPSGVARLVEEGARRGDGLNRSRLPTNLLLLHDLALEAGRVAQAHNATSTTGDHVTEALRRRRALQTGASDRVRAGILSGQEMTATYGTAIGQINGLGIYDAHPAEASFAVPMRVSAIVSVGQQESVIDIEREAEQADADHVRGMMTMEGYLASRYGQHRSISLAARIRFEQQHGGTGGDSASAAELFALLSALAQVPIRRSLAVTGAVGQYGEIQPIGGVNTKIEGFWTICRMRYEQGERPEGGYGVLIPAVNARDLMLNPDVAASIAQGDWFHIWPITTVDDGLPLLTGLSAEDVHKRVDSRLQTFYDLAVRSRQGR